MAAGKPLTDAMRVPWVEAICQHLRKLAADGADVGLAFSGLRKAHREPLRQCGCKTRFLCLDGDREAVTARLQARTGHVLPISQLDSRLASVARPCREHDVRALGIEA